jgi:class 3 adenylate cyclase
MSTEIPANEPERLQALRNYAIVDTLPEIAFDDIAELAAQICGCPAGLVSFLDASRQWIKAKYGIPPDVVECPREVSVCATTICGDDILHVSDLTRDPRFNASPLVTGSFGLRFYCGVPLITNDGHALGTLCVIDFTQREITFEQREALRRLSRQTMAQLELRRMLLERNAMMRDLEGARDAALADKAKSDQLLLNILPPAVAVELRTSGRVQPRFFDSATVMFTDFKEFTHLVETLEPAHVVGQLDQHFATFDDIVTTHRLEKLKTIGDAYLAVGGAPESNRTHPMDAALAALQMLHHLAKLNRQREKLRLPAWQARIGINTGPLIAGVVGTHKFTYDVWGNTVNIAQRIEAAGVEGRINIAESTWQHVNSRFETEPRGAIDVKHKGAVNMYFLNRIKAEFSADPDGLTPNARF